VTFHEATSNVRRCEACGQRLSQPPPPQCPLCGFDFVGDDQTTGADLTPYANAYAGGEPGWWDMCKWVWSAGWGRHSHIALMRASAASIAFSRISLVLLAASLTLLEVTRKGWRWVSDSPSIEPTGSMNPSGKGWLHVAAAPRPLLPDRAPEIPVDLWWNITHTVLTLAVTMALGWIVMWFVMQLIRWGVAWAHKPPYRYEQRMTAALHYSTAWCVPVLLAGGVVALRPISFVGKIADWQWCPPKGMFEFAAAVPACFGVAMWWFWLIRLGATARDGTRGRVIGFFAIVVPALVGVTAAGWWYAAEPMYPRLFEKLGVNF
jgi:hypothetical protein